MIVVAWNALCRKIAEKYAHTHAQTNMNACMTVKIWINWFINFRFLGLILYYRGCIEPSFKIHCTLWLQFFKIKSLREKCAPFIRCNTRFQNEECYERGSRWFLYVKQPSRQLSLILGIRDGTFSFLTLRSKVSCSTNWAIQVPPGMERFKRRLLKGKESGRVTGRTFQTGIIVNKQSQYSSTTK